MVAYRFAFAALALTATEVLGSPLQSQSAYAVKDSFAVPKTVSKVGPAHADQILNLQIGLKQANFDKLEQQLYDGRCSYH